MFLADLHGGAQLHLPPPPRSVYREQPDSLGEIPGFRNVCTGREQTLCLVAYMANPHYTHTVKKLIKWGKIRCMCII